MPRIKRHRGGQPGNQNARKHGLYSPYLNHAEYMALQKAIRKGVADEGVAAIRIKLESALRHRPTDKRLYREGSKLLVNWFRSHYKVDQTSVKELRSATHDVFSTIREQLAATIKANSPEEAKKLTKQLKLNLKKMIKHDGTNRIY